MIVLIDILIVFFDILIDIESVCLLELLNLFLIFIVIWIVWLLEEGFVGKINGGEEDLFEKVYKGVYLCLLLEFIYFFCCIIMFYVYIFDKLIFG